MKFTFTYSQNTHTPFLKLFFKKLFEIKYIFALYYSINESAVTKFENNSE